MNNHREQLESLLAKQEGLLLTKQIGLAGIEKESVETMVSEGILRKMNNTLYLTEEACQDEMFLIQAYGNKSVFSHETAVQLHGLGEIEGDGSELVVTLPSGSSAIFLRSLSVNVHFMKKDLYGLGLMSVKSPYGRTLLTYNQERTLCDLVRGRNELPELLILEAFKRYLQSEHKNMPLLFEFARHFKVDSTLKNYIG